MYCMEYKIRLAFTLMFQNQQLKKVTGLVILCPVKTPVTKALNTNSFISNLCKSISSNVEFKKKKIFIVYSSISK